MIDAVTASSPPHEHPGSSDQKFAAVVWPVRNGVIAMYLKKLVLLSAFVALAGSASHMNAQAGDPKDELLQKLNRQFVLTKMTADGTDVVKAGSAVTLHKDGWHMCSIQAKSPLTNFYKDGKLSAGKFAWGMAMGLAQPNMPTSTVPIRNFVADEKFWVSAIDFEKGYIVFKVYSDAYQDVRYYAQLAFLLNKKSAGPVDDLLKAISEVVTAEPASGGAGPTASAPAAPAGQDQSAPPQQVMAPIAPPPPPTDTPPPAPPTVSLGQTMDQVVAVMGQPKSLAKVGTKTIFNYPDLKVIFVDGKVSDVQ
jgi:hypothetical protein